MKQLLFNRIIPAVALLLTVAASAAMLGGCNEDDAPFLEMSTHELIIDAQAGKHIVEITSNTQWEATCPGTWCMLGRKSGSHQGSIELIIDANRTVEERTVIIPIQYAGNATVNLVVRQSAAEIALELSEESIEFYRDADGSNVVITCNSAWQATSSRDWCTVSPAVGTGNGTLNVSVTKNTSENERTAKVSVVSEAADGTSVMQTIEIIQKATAPMITLSPTEKIVGGLAEEFVIIVTSNIEWDADADSDWLTVQYDSNTGDGTIKVSVDDNKSGKERHGTITVATADTYENREVHTVKVTQSSDEYYLEVPITEYFLAEAPAQVDVRYILGGIDCTVDAESNAAWVTISGITDDVVRLNVAENEGTEVRTAQVSIFTVGQSGTPVSETVTIVQSPTQYILDIFFSDTQLNPEGETREFELISTVVPVTVKCSSDWCTAILVPSYDRIAVTADPNQTGKTRSAVVRVSVTLPTGEVLSKDFTVTQESLDITFEFKQDSFLVQYQGNTVTAEIVSASEWTVKDVSDLPAWIEIPVTSGPSGQAVLIRVAANKAIMKRNYDIVFHNLLLKKDIVLHIEQEKNPSSPLEDYRYLGKGYDVSGEYAADIDVRAFVLDWTKLIDADYIADIIKPGSTYENTIYGKTISEYQNGLSTSASVGGSYAGFGAQVKVSFSESSYMSSENEFGLFRHITKKLSVKVDPQLRSAQLKECMNEQAAADINGAMSAGDVMLKYGTHVITGFVLGGSLDFTMSADRSAMSTTTEWGAALSGGFNLAGTGVNAGIEYNQYNSVRNESSNFESRLIVRGGDSQYASGLGSQQAKDNWLGSLSDPELWSLVDYDGSMLIPIWEFADNSSRRNELQQAATNRINGVIGSPASTHRQFTINNTYIKFVGGDEGDDQVDLEWSITYELDGKDYKCDDQKFSMKKEGKETKYIGSNGLKLDQSLTYTKDHTLTIRISGKEIDYMANPDDHFSATATLNYQRTTNKWYLGSKDVTNTTFTMLTKDGSDDMSEHTFKLDWIAK